MSPKLQKILLNALFILVPASWAAGHESEKCKSVPGSADWPSQRDWRRFNESLGGRLLQPAPPGAVCHPGQRTYDPDKCPAVIDGWSNYEFHVGHPTSVIVSQFSNDSCLPNASYPCDDAGYPSFVVNATTPEGVQLAVKFAKKNNVRLVVKGTGHDFIGRSIGPNALSIWTHHMKGLKYHKGSFTPKGCKSIAVNAITAGAGSEMMDLYEFAAGHGEVTVGGTGATVGVGGYLTGGGHSILSPRYGLAADQVLEIDMVTPSGEIITANECQNEDLFWAMRGGGGSTFGVITSVTLQTHPSPKILNLGVGIIGSAQDPKLADWIAHFFSKFPYLESKGISGYMLTGRDIENIVQPGADPLSGVLASLVLQDTEDEKDIVDLIGSVVEELQARFPDSGIATFQQVFKYPSFLDWFKVNKDSGEAGTDICGGGRLLSEKHLTADVDALVEMIGTNMDAVGRFSAFIVSGKGVHEAQPRGGGNAVVPAWRKAIVHCATFLPFEPLNKTAEMECINRFTKMNTAMKKLAPDSGAYMNENSYFENDYQEVFWGNNYERLLNIKKKIDPTDVFWCHPCVGDEGWKEVGDKLCRV